MLRLSSFHSSAALLSLIAAPLAAQGVDSIEVTPHNVTRPVTQNPGTGTGACQQFLPWAYDASGSRVRQQQIYAWSVSNSTDFQVDTAGGNVCARQSQLSDTVTTTVTAIVVGSQTTGTANFTVTPDPALPPTPVAAGEPQAGAEPMMDTTLLPPAPAPTNVTVTPVSPTTLKISWGGVAGASGYHLYRSSTAGGQFTPQNTALLQGNLTTDPTLMPNTTAYYKVAAVVPNKSPGFSAVASNTTPPAPAPASLTATLSPDQKAVTLTWPSPPGASGYRLLKNGAPVSARTLRGTSYTDNQQLLPLIEYRYQVAALYSTPNQGEFEGDLTQMPTAKVVRTQAPYRVVFRGFKVNHQPQDDPLQADGKGDEVYLSALRFGIGGLATVNNTI